MCRLTILYEQRTSGNNITCSYKSNEDIESNKDGVAMYYNVDTDKRIGDVLESVIERVKDVLSRFCVIGFSCKGEVNDFYSGIERMLRMIARYRPDTLLSIGFLTDSSSESLSIMGLTTFADGLRETRNVTRVYGDSIVLLREDNFEEVYGLLSNYYRCFQYALEWRLEIQADRGIFNRIGEFMYNSRLYKQRWDKTRFEVIVKCKGPNGVTYIIDVPKSEHAKAFIERDKDNVNKISPAVKRRDQMACKICGKTKMEILE